MGTAPGQSMEGSKKIDMNMFLSKYSEKYKLESFLRKDNFKTLLVTSLKKSEFAEGIPLVIKLFPIENENYYFKYSQEFTEIKNMYSNLESSPHVIPIIKLKQMKEANAGIVIRQYIKYNLKHALYYLTLSSEIEKKWICFQLLQGLNQIHSKLKCHGDIKPENILISSKLSVFLSDISVYKPVYLIIENLQLYNNYFYSNSVDRACYLAPERFVHNLNGIDKNKINELNKEMDIFSLGIVFAEIFLDRQSIFTQNDIINYKNKKIDLKEKLNDISDINVRNVIKNMIELESRKRIGLSDLIIFFKNELCPPPITTFISHINLMIINYGYYQNDLLVALLHKHFIQIWKCLCYNNKLLEKLEIPTLKKKLNKFLILNLLTHKYNIYNIRTEFLLAFISNDNIKDNTDKFIEKEIISFDNENIIIKTYFKMDDPKNSSNVDNKNDCTIIIMKYLISCLENLKYISTYFSIFEMLYNLSKILIINKNPNVIIDIIIPNYINLFKMDNSKLSIEVYNSLIDILNLINFDDLILNKIDYNVFNFYIFDNIYKLFLNSEKLEVKCAIISRLDEIIELENNFLLAYLNACNIMANNEKNKNKKDLMKSQFYQELLYQTYIKKNSSTKSSVEKNNMNINNDIDFNYIHDNYLNDLNVFKKKLKDIVKKIMEDGDARNSSLKLLIIQKYREICLFCGNYNENEQLFNHLFILFNQDNYYVQKEIIKLFPSLILLFGTKLFYDYFLVFIESSCQKKNSELIIIEIIDALILLSKMNIIRHIDGYSKSFKVLKCYKLLIPYIVHPNYLLRNKLNSLFNEVISEKYHLNGLYISFNQKLKKILSVNNKSITIINATNNDLINKMTSYYSIPREIFLLYKYNIDCTYFNINYIDTEKLLSDITKIKKEHFINKLKINKNLMNNLGLIRKEDIFDVKEKSFLKEVKEEFIKIFEKEKIYDDKNLAFINHINTITILLNEINLNKKNKNFVNIWYQICTKRNIYYSKIIYLLKVLNFQLDIRNITTNNIALTSEDNFIEEKEYKDWNVLDDIKSSHFQSINPMNYIIKDHQNTKFCYELNLNQSESIIKLIPVNCFFTKFYQNFFVSISDEGIIRLHLIYNESDFENIYTIKNRAQYKIDLGNFILKKNLISYFEKKNKIIIIIAIKDKLEILTIELNNEKYDNNVNDLKDSCLCNNIECKSKKEIICIENMGKSNKNFIVLGNNDNSLSFYNYIENNIDYINNCSYFSPSYGNISLITSLKFSDNILISTSKGFIILYDYALRIFKNVYSFSQRRRINQIIEYIPKDINENIFDIKKQGNNLKDNFIFILTNDDQITLWNLSCPNPIIIYELIKVNKIEDHKKIKTSNIIIPRMEKSFLKEENYSSYSINDFSPESQFIKMNINFIWDIKKSSVEIITGEKKGICKALNFCDENLKKIKNKQGHKNNKFNQIIFNDDKSKKIDIRNNSKYKKEEGTFINKLIYAVKNSDEDKIGNLNINNEDYEFKEMNDLIILRDCFADSNIEFIISAYSNGTIKLRII